MEKALHTSAEGLSSSARLSLPISRSLEEDLLLLVSPLATSQVEDHPSYEEHLPEVQALV